MCSYGQNWCVCTLASQLMPLRQPPPPGGPPFPSMHFNAYLSKMQLLYPNLCLYAMGWVLLLMFVRRAYPPEWCPLLHAIKHPLSMLSPSMLNVYPFSEYIISESITLVSFSLCCVTSVTSTYPFL
eukprot:jgi/Botrbrau1/14328/Bobra.0287s0020.1